MSNTPQKKLPFDSEYLAELKRRVREAGRNAIADEADIATTTVHRRINEGKMTYSSAMKLVAALNATKAPTDELLPPPFVGVVNPRHYLLCQVAARLVKFEPEHRHVVDDVIRVMLETVQKLESDQLIGDAISNIRSPK